jgi:hypothetical protein
MNDDPVAWSNLKALQFATGSSGTFLKTSGFAESIISIVDGDNGLSSQNKFGRNEDVDGALEHVWSNGGTLTYLAAAEAMTLTSSNVNDVGTYRVQGVDASYDELIENVVNNGTVGVDSTGSFLRVYRMVDISDGGPEGTCNLGTITATSKTASTVQATIAPGEGQTLMSHFTVPAGKSAYVTRWQINVDKTAASATVDFNLMVRPQNGCFNIKKHLGLSTGAQSYADDEFFPYFKVEEKSDIRIDSKSSSTNADVGASYDMILRDN